MDKSIKIVRLVSGEDIVGEYLLEDNKTIISNPMTIIVQRKTSGSAMMMVPWLPVELISDNITVMDNNHILTVVEPRDSLIEYYLNMVKQTQLEVKVNEKYLQKANEQLEDYIEEEVDFYSNMDDIGDEESTRINPIETIDDLLEQMGSVDKKRLH